MSPDRIWADLAQLLEGIGQPPFTGQVTLHCNQGHVVRYDVHRIGLRPGELQEEERIVSESGLRAIGGRG